MRRTKQKIAIENVFNCSERPLTIDEVVTAAQKEVPSINSATVYRNVKQLHESGFIEKISSAIAGTLYEKKSHLHHHHFYCRECKRSFDLPGCPISTIALPKGYTAESHELFFTGLCPHCSK